MTINEQDKETQRIVTELKRVVDEGYGFFASIARYITENYQPKTTSTDIEGLRKEFTQQLTEKVPADNFSNGYIWVCSQNADDVWNFFAPHLSNKSELKKEAVGGFVKLLKEYEFYSGDIGVTANRMGSSMSDLEFLAKQYLSSNENEESEGK